MPNLVKLSAIVILLLLAWTGWQQSQQGLFPSAESSPADMTNQAKTESVINTPLPAIEDVSTRDIESDNREQVLDVDAEALYQQASLLKGCQRALADDTAMQAWLDDANQNNESHFLIEEKLAQFERCKDVDRSIDYLKLLERAALAGSEHALTKFWATRDEEYYRFQNIDLSDRDAMIEARYGLSQKKYQVAEALAVKGSEKAMMWRYQLR